MVYSKYMRELTSESVLEIIKAYENDPQQLIAVLLKRVKTSVRLPLISSFSLDWIKFVKEFYPDLLNHLPSEKNEEQNLKAFVASGLANARKIMDLIRKGNCDAALVGIMCCDGCTTGGGVINGVLQQ